MSFRSIGGDAQAAGSVPTPERVRRGSLPDCRLSPCAARARRLAPVFLGGWSAHAPGLGCPQAAAPRLIHSLQTKPAIAFTWPSILVWKPSTPSNLLNPPKGLSMAKTARVSVYLAMKFVPVSDMPENARLQQSMTLETVIHEDIHYAKYGMGSGNYCRPQKRPVPTRKTCRVLGWLPDRQNVIVGGCGVPLPITKGDSFHIETKQTETLNPQPAPALGWHGETPRKPIEIVFWGAA